MRLTDDCHAGLTPRRREVLNQLIEGKTEKQIARRLHRSPATEIVHIGQTVMSFDGTIDYFRDTVFNYPTMAECYKVAALDGLNKLNLLKEADVCGMPIDEIEVAIDTTLLLA